MSVLAGTLLVPAAASAQASGDTTEVPTVVVTATRGTAAPRSHTATVSVLDGAVLRAEGVTHLGDALRRVPGLALSRTSSFGSQVALFTRGGQSNYTRVLIDGVPLNEPGGTLDLGRITLDDIERIEVVRGPASVLYGSEAVTGVIQLFTRRGDGRTRVDAEIGGGSYGAQRAALGVSGGIGRIDGAADGVQENAAGGRPPVTWSLRGDHHASNGILAFNNAYRNDGVVASVGTTGSAIADVRLTARYNGSLYEFPTGSDGTPEDRNARRTVHRLMLGLDAARRWSERVDTRVQVSSSELRPRDDDGPDDAADTTGFYGYHARARCGTCRRRCCRRADRRACRKRHRRRPWPARRRLRCHARHGTTTANRRTRSTTARCRAPCRDPLRRRRSGTGRRRHGRSCANRRGSAAPLRARGSRRIPRCRPRHPAHHRRAAGTRSRTAARACRRARSSAAPHRARA